MGTWILCIDCMVKEFKWRILERVFFVVFAQFYIREVHKNKYAQFHVNTYAEFA
jgi:hypothetical protein